MRPAVIWPLLVAFVVAQDAWVEDEHDIHEGDFAHARVERDIHYDPNEQHARVKRKNVETAKTVERSDGSIRRPRQVHQYEVHEISDEGSAPTSPPYEQMLAASAEHHHRVAIAPRELSGGVNVSPGANTNDQYKFLVGVPKVLPTLNVYRPTVQSAGSPVLRNVQPVSFTNAPLNVVPVPLSVANPDIAVHTPISGPVAVASEPRALPLQLLADDQTVAGTGHKHSHGFAQGGGYQKHQHHHKDHGGKSTKGYHSDQHLEKGAKGHKSDEVHRKEYEEAQGAKKKHHDNAGHKGSHEEEAHGHRGSKFDEKKGHKKGHKTKGYHNKYHKDEFHKEHKFYDDYHKSGEHHRFGKFHAKHASNESGKKKAHHVNAGHDYVERGKKGYSNKGHVDSDHKGHKGKHGHEEHSQHHEHHGKKGGKEGGKQWGYGKKH